MAEVRINGRRMPVLQAVSVVRDLVAKIEQWGSKRNMALTAMRLNGKPVDLDAPEFAKLKITENDLIEARLETPNQMAFESLQVAQEMAELLIFDLKVATIQMWEGNAAHQKSIETLIDDCHLFLTLAARPLDLLGVPLSELPDEGERCLRQLDAVAQSVEDATLLCVHGELKDSCTVLVQRVLAAVEKWLGLSGRFGEILSIDNAPMDTLPYAVGTEDLISGQSKA